MSRALIAAERAELDAYATPLPLARAICQYLRRTAAGDQPDEIMEPSAGQGPFVVAARETWPEAHVTAVDIDPACRAPLKAAGAHVVLVEEWVGLARKLALHQVKKSPATRLVIGNPPYREAQEHIEAAVGWVREGDRVAFLLRLAFLESSRRLAFWRAYTPALVAPIVPRPSFTGGGTDATAYGLFVWRRGRRGGSRLARAIVWKPERRAAGEG